MKAFRDTWKDGIHSYLTYLRDRLTVARDLLTESGSIFVQIGDENVHRVRAVMDEVFGTDNFVAQIAFEKTTGADSRLSCRTSSIIIALVCQEIKTVVKYRQLYTKKDAGDEGADALHIVADARRIGVD